MQEPTIKRLASDSQSKGWYQLVQQIETWGKELGFNQIGISHTNLEKEEADLLEWLAQGMHGAMAYMSSHGSKRSHPEQLVAGTISIISVRMNYLSALARNPRHVLSQSDKAYIARYALGRDYHKIIRKRLQRLAERLDEVTENLVYRAFCDSAPVLEKPIGQKAGLGWAGKHTVLILSLIHISEPTRPY